MALPSNLDDLQSICGEDKVFNYLEVLYEHVDGLRVDAELPGGPLEPDGQVQGAPPLRLGADPQLRGQPPPGHAGPGLTGLTRPLKRYHMCINVGQYYLDEHNTQVYLLVTSSLQLHSTSFYKPWNYWYHHSAGTIFGQLFSFSFSTPLFI